MTQTSVRSDLNNPANPYASFMVRASAGSGKTFQLSRRFLALVAAGAEPSSILAITFTKKAAAEMRERVIQDAIGFGKGDVAFSEFTQLLLECHQDMRGSGRDMPPLLSPSEVSTKILQNTQSLAITTIDSILTQWCLRFPWETRQTKGNHTMIAPWSIPSSKDQRQALEDSWNRALQAVFAAAESAKTRSELIHQILEASPNQELRSSWLRLQTLIQAETFIWLAQHVRGDARCYYEIDPKNASNPVELVHQDLHQIIQAISNLDKKQAALDALARRDLESLVKSTILTKEYNIHGTTISKKIRDAFPVEIGRIQAALDTFIDMQRLTQMNDHATLLWGLYHAWSTSYHQHKVAQNWGSFADSLKGVYQLFHQDCPGPRWLIQRSVRHLMLDEFQDTSQLQWATFCGLAKDILAGRSSDPNSLSGTVFIVGDTKQSIYGFREADPEIMDVAFRDLESLGLIALNMSESWRTTPIVLQFINQLFQGTGLIHEFPEHKTARRSGQLVLADHGSIRLLPLVQSASANGTETDASEASSSLRQDLAAREAEQLATYIASCLQGNGPLTIWDKDIAACRPPRASDIAILYRTTTDADIHETALRKYHLPALREEKRGFFTRSEIVDVTALLRWLTWPSDTVALCTLLRSPPCGLSDSELQHVLFLATEEGQTPAGEHKILSAISSMHRELSDLLKEAKDRCSTKTVFDTVLWWLRSTNAASVYRTNFGALEGELAASNLMKFVELVRAAETSGDGSWHDFLESFTRSKEDDETGNANTDTNAIRLLTIHKSKGLEFPIVILVGAAQDWYRPDDYWVRSTTPGQEGLKYIATRDERPKKDPQVRAAIVESERRAREENARLLYVALTRAQQHLVISGHFKPTQKTPEPPPESFYQLARQALISLDADDDFGVLSLTSEGNSFSETAPINADKRKKGVEGERKGAASLHRLPALAVKTPSKTSRQGTIHGESFQGPYVRAQSELKRRGALFGTATHHILECFIQGRSVDFSAIALTLRHNETVLFEDHDDPDMMIEVAYQEAVRLLESPLWRQVMSDAVDVFTEPPIAQLVTESQRTNLVYGQPDLVVEKSTGETWIIDFKTTMVSADTDLDSFCREQGYDSQLKAYGSGVAILMPQQKIRTFVLFTYSCNMIEI